MPERNTLSGWDQRFFTAWRRVLTNRTLEKAGRHSFQNDTAGGVGRAAGRCADLAARGTGNGRREKQQDFLRGIAKQNRLRDSSTA